MAALDLALLVACDGWRPAAGVFTTNRAIAAPVAASRASTCAARAAAPRAIVVNSGCANACTGEVGAAVANRWRPNGARAVGCDAEQVLVASTGVIGVALDTAKVGRASRRRPALDRGGDADAARAIMTTDPFPKSHAASAMIARGAVTRRRHGEGLRDDRAAHGDDARRS